MLYIVGWIVPYVALLGLKILASHEAIDDKYILITNFANYYRYYLIGYLCRKYEPLNKFLFANRIVGAVAVIAFFANWFFYEMHNMVLIFIGTLGAIIMLQNFVTHRVSEHSKIGKCFIYLGKCSLGIYVIHYFFPSGH